MTNTNEIFDIDNIIGDIVSHPENTIGQPKDTGTTIRRRSKVSDSFLFFDLETIPDYSRSTVFDLPQIPQPAKYIAENDSPAPSKIVEGKEDDVKAIITKAQADGKLVPRIILEAALKIEAAKDKPRSGVQKFLQGLISAIDNEAATIQAAVEANRKSMSVTPEFCRIVSFGWAIGNEPSCASTFGDKDGTEDHDTYERCVLKKFWELAKRSKTICGFNIIGFDLPVIYVRSAMLGVEPSRMIDPKPWGGGVCDIMQARWPRGGQKKLKDFAKIIGLPIPAGDVDGSQVEELLKSDPQKVSEYCRSDVSLTREIYATFRGLFWA